MLHIDLPTRAEIEALAAYRGSPAVSIYLSTTPLTQDAQADRIGLKNLLRTALAEMADADADKRSIEPIRESIEALVEDDDFWVEQANSLAIFATPKSLRTFRLGNKLGNAVEVSDRFHIKPLLRAITFPHNAYVLAISMGAVRLVEVSADLPPHEVKVPGLVRGAADAAGRRSHLERKGDMESGESTSESALLTRYARAVDQALRPVLAGHGRPLIVAAAEPMATIFHGVCSYPHLAEATIPGTADRTPDHELAAAARGILDQVYAAEIKALGETYAARAAQDRATCDLGRAARAATFGAVETLIVDMDAELPGRVDENGAVTLDAKADGVNYSVTDEIARRALLSGARVIAARRGDVPGGGELAAVLRYPV
ncbi:hypothetical protein M0638_04345 [Roseomonas sp. NAR14]|uniref:Uncharacterized protein n=1 Tax=Roseomonas acroporae TaxID=2937791 RepID=A0A9X1Y5U8_9PROT|nr:hypothetical protein [Roseomonas acroporae]MCK8783610.1 hypothetical protein [Roseomonas acroporae]